MPLPPGPMPWVLNVPRSLLRQAQLTIFSLAPGVDLRRYLVPMINPSWNTPRGGPDPSEVRRDLHRLIKSLFSDEELLRWIRHGPDADIADALPGGTPSKDHLVDALIRQLDACGRLSDEFFARLREARQARSTEISQVEERWRTVPRAARSSAPHAQAPWPHALLCLGVSAFFFMVVSFGLAQFLPHELVLPGTAGVFLLSVAFVFLYERRIKESLVAAAIGLYSLQRRTLIASMAGGLAVGAPIGNDLARDLHGRGMTGTETEALPLPHQSPKRASVAAQGSTSSFPADTTDTTLDGNSLETTGDPSKSQLETPPTDPSTVDAPPPTCPKGQVPIEGGELDGHRIGPFCMDAREASVESYETCITRGKCSDATKSGYRCTALDSDPNLPMNCIDIEQAKKFCKSRGARLPTDLEWRWAAQGREEARRFPWGDLPPESWRPEPCTVAVMESNQMGGCGADRPHSVTSAATKRRQGRSRDGAYDLAGNLAEWTSTRRGEKNLVCGGSFVSKGDELSTSSCTPRDPTTGSHEIGIRCVQQPKG